MPSELLNRLAVAAPGWLRAHSRAEWLARYGRRAEGDRLPKPEPQRQASVPTVGLDGDALLDALDGDAAPAWLRDVPAVKAPRHTWLQPYDRRPEGVRWRTATDGGPPAARLISSPHDPEARDATPYTTAWIGYHVHFTGSCEADAPPLITHVGTTAGPGADGAVTTAIPAAPQAKPLLPRLHSVGTGDPEAALLATTPRA